ncbi:MAG: hypothetical protein H6865_08035 [Rhodospirillales bacterium]|nr:hypothetical protein [Alphaproteobacteria bacterium]MCB9987565.1 hypothetical protein [Rhodospirillales bacterium]USO07714.1 MAG: hypothetical protein H6866_00315 [Rhodospirillales bacterium]
MQDAVGVVLSGEHGTSKVAACAFHPDHPGQVPVACVSERPVPLRAHFPWDARIGASSQFIHAELSALLRFGGPWTGAHVCVTDPFCPNCAKIMAEAGVQAIHIDHKGFEKDFIARNGDEFKSMSMLIAEKAGISVHVVNRKAGSVTPIAEHFAVTRPAAAGVEFFDIAPGMSVPDAAAQMRERLGARDVWTLAFVSSDDGAQKGLLVYEALPSGITPEDFRTRTGDTGKYRFPIDPLTRLGIVLRRMDMTLANDEIACARVPSSRALVNALGMGMSRFALASALPDHDPKGVEALALLTAKGIVSVTEVA